MNIKLVTTRIRIKIINTFCENIIKPGKIHHVCDAAAIVNGVSERYRYVLKLYARVLLHHKMFLSEIKVTTALEISTHLSICCDDFNKNVFQKFSTSKRQKLSS